MGSAGGIRLVPSTTCSLTPADLCPLLTYHTLFCTVHVWRGHLSRVMILQNFQQTKQWVAQQWHHQIPLTKSCKSGIRRHQCHRTGVYNFVSLIHSVMLPLTPTGTLSSSPGSPPAASPAARTKDSSGLWSQDLGPEAQNTRLRPLNTVLWAMDYRHSV